MHSDALESESQQCGASAESDSALHNVSGNVFLNDVSNRLIESAQARLTAHRVGVNHTVKLRELTWKHQIANFSQAPGYVLRSSPELAAKCGICVGTRCVIHKTALNSYRRWTKSRANEVVRACKQAR